MRFLPKITAVVFFAMGLFWVLTVFVAILSSEGEPGVVAAIASACFLLVLVIIMAEIANKLQNIYEILHQQDEKNKG